MLALSVPLIVPVTADLVELEARVGLRIAHGEAFRQGLEGLDSDAFLGRVAVEHLRGFGAVAWAQEVFFPGDGGAAVRPVKVSLVLRVVAQSEIVIVSGEVVG